MRILHATKTPKGTSVLVVKCDRCNREFFWRPAPPYRGQMMVRCPYCPLSEDLIDQFAEFMQEQEHTTPNKEC